MIKVKVTKKCISVLGHADYDDYGKDIVCASVSSIVLCSVEAIANFDTDAIEIKQSNDKLDIIINKEDNITHVVLTKKDGTTQEVDIEDGKDGISLENIEIVDRNLEVTYGGETENLGQVAPNIQVGTTTTGLPSSQASVVNVGTDLNPILNFTIPKGEAGAIKMLIVNELPATGEEDTIYLVPLENPTEEGNNYAEYVYINGEWELLGKIGVEVKIETITNQEIDGMWA